MTRHRLLQALLTAVAAVTLTACTGTNQAQESGAPAAGTAVAPTPRPASPTEGVVGEGEVPSQAGDSHAHHHGDLDPETLTAAAEAAAQFIQGWSHHDPPTRQRLLEQVASAELLAIFTDPRFQPIAADPSGPVHIHAEGFGATARQRLDDSTTVQVTLVMDPATEWGWSVISIERT